MAPRASEVLLCPTAGSRNHSPYMLATTPGQSILLTTETAVKTLNDVVDELLIQLGDHLSPGDDSRSNNHLHLRQAFERFGLEASASGLSLEESMSGAITALRLVFEDGQDLS